MQTPVVVLVGAGLSTASGIPDYRGNGGVWARFDQNEFHIERLHADPVRFWDQRIPLTRHMRFLDAEPNDGHRTLAAAARDGRVATIITQNIDGLHQKAGTPNDRLIEVHGNAALCRCLSCRDTVPMTDVIRAHRPGTAPRCVCGGLLKPDVVLFGEIVHLLPHAEAAAAAAGTFVCVGTSLQVWPVAGLVSTAYRGGADIIIVNRDPTPFDAHAKGVMRGDVVDALSKLFADPHP